MRIIVLANLLGLGLLACTASEDGDLAGKAGSVIEEGVASHYADSLAGRPTASGEPYDPNAATCAHRTMKLGTVVEIHALRTDKTARCRINDRGPFAKDRILDVSRHVAEQLEMDGVAKIELRKVETPAAD